MLADFRRLKKAQEGSKRFKKVQEGSRRFKRVQEDSRMFKKVQEGARMCKKVPERLLNHVSLTSSEQAIWTCSVLIVLYNIWLATWLVSLLPSVMFCTGSGSR